MIEINCETVVLVFLSHHFEGCVPVPILCITNKKMLTFLSDLPAGSRCPEIKIDRIKSANLQS